MSANVVSVVASGLLVLIATLSGYILQHALQSRREAVQSKRETSLRLIESRREAYGSLCSEVVSLLSRGRNARSSPDIAIMKQLVHSIDKKIGEVLMLSDVPLQNALFDAMYALRAVERSLRKPKFVKITVDSRFVQQRFIKVFALMRRELGIPNDEITNLELDLRLGAP